jgi:putative membrane protein
MIRLAAPHYLWRSMDLVVRIIISSLAVMVTGFLLKSGIIIDNYWAALGVAAVLAVLNSFLKPLLILFTIPFTLVTLGLFLLVINAVIIIITDNLVDGFSVNGFWWALLFSLVLSLITSLMERLAKVGRKGSDKGKD